MFEEIKKIAICNKLENIQIRYILPEQEIAIFDDFIVKCGFETPIATSEVFCFNPYQIIHTKFMKKTLRRNGSFLSDGWQVARYDALTEDLILRLENAMDFPEYLKWNFGWESLDLRFSLVLFNNDDIIGYLLHQRLMPHSAAVPCFAANPRYRTAGLYLLKYYIHMLHEEAPSIYEIRCHFTEKTSIGKKLFTHYVENRYHRHSIEKTSILSFSIDSL